MPFALITGASRGIGAACARRLFRSGLPVVLNARSAGAALQGVAADCGGAELLPFDVGDRAAARAALEGLVARRGAPAVVVLAAGLARDVPLAGMEDDDWDQVLAANLGGFHHVLRPLIGAMQRARGGRIVAIASVSGQAGNPGQVAYSAAKGGLIAACKALAREVARRGITVNAVSPGMIDTGMLAGLPVEAMLAAVPAGRLGTCDEVAAAVGFLCSAEAAYITGQVIGVNGGLYT
jgi:3-oxoacyl-[acyl-carrier protein] reductase